MKINLEYDIESPFGHIVDVCMGKTKTCIWVPVRHSPLAIKKKKKKKAVII